MISAKRVEEVFSDCLFKDSELVDGKPAIEPVVVNGLVHNFGFHSQRLESHRDEVKSILLELPEPFLKSKGGGWSFLNACVDRSGNQWGQHMNMEQLFSLGIGLKLASYCMPREMWSILPGGVPYIMVNDVEG